MHLQPHEQCSLHRSPVELHPQMLSKTHRVCRHDISCSELHPWAHFLMPKSSVCLDGSTQEARMLTHASFRLGWQASCLPNRDASDILTDAHSNVSIRHRGMLGVGARIHSHFLESNSTRSFSPWQQKLPLPGALQHSRGTLWARSFHSARVLQQQNPAFAAEQDEERIASSTTGSPSNAESAADEGLEIAKLPISRLLVDSLARRGITKLFPIQRAVLEPGLRGQDLVARAKTGTGKTLAFGIPILDRIIKENEKMNRRYGKAPLAVIMAPTRELAKQVETELKDSAPTLELVCVYGGVSIEAQVRQLQRGVDIAVGTPGRFIDLLERGALNLGEVKYIVLDEADRMLAVGFVEAVQKIFEYLPPLRQCMLFSATMPPWVQDLARRYLKNHLIVDLVGKNDEKIATGIKLLSVTTSGAAKLSILSDLIKVYGKGAKSIVFTQTKRDADDVAMSLSKSVYCEPLHGDITQFQRERTLKSFRDGKISVLIATDVAARGLDIPNVDLVVHYEVANDSETFVHRSGRTGRAGKEGTAILMHSPYQRRTLEMLERDLKFRFQSIEPPTAVDVVRSSTEQAAAKLQSVHPEVRNIFLPTAEKLFSEEGIGGFAAALAHLCGYSEEMASRSLLTHQTRPNIVDEPFGGERFGGRSFQRGSPSGRSGGSFGGRPGGFSNRPSDGGNWSNRGSSGSDSFSRSPGSSGSSDWSSRSSFGSGGGGWGANRPPSNYGGGSSSYDSAYSSNRSPAASSNSSGDWANRPFSGQCLKCGQTGHRAIECPK
eukprot:c23265_g1_i1 orf=404-2731(+)